ncbi:hypothetical protein [Sorangium sp. So ce233]
MTASVTVAQHDTFYCPSRSLLEGEHGEVVWSRPLSGATPKPR